MSTTTLLNPPRILSKKETEEFWNKAEVAFYEKAEITRLGSIRNLREGITAAFNAFLTSPELTSTSSSEFVPTYVFWHCLRASGQNVGRTLVLCCAKPLSAELVAKAAVHDVSVQNSENWDLETWSSDRWPVMVNPCNYTKASELIAKARQLGAHCIVIDSGSNYKSYLSKFGRAATKLMGTYGENKERCYVVNPVKDKK